MQPRRLMSRFPISRLVLALAVVSTAAALVAGCSKSTESTEALPDATELLQQSSQTTKALKSAHLEIVADGKVPGLPVRQLSGDLTNVPSVAVQGNATLEAFGSETKADLVVIDGTLYGAFSAGNWQDFGPAADIYDPSVILNPDLGLANMLANFSDPTSASSEKVNGVDTVKVTGTISLDAVKKLIPPLEVSGPIPGTAWIEKDGDHNLVQAELQPSDDSSLRLTLSKWNEPVTITKPPLS